MSCILGRKETEYLFTGDVSGQVFAWHKLDNTFSLTFKIQIGEAIRFLDFYNPKHFLFIVTDTKVILWDYEKEEIFTSFDTKDRIITNFVNVKKYVWISCGKEIFVCSIQKMLNKSSEKLLTRDLDSTFVRTIKEHESKIVSLQVINSFAHSFVFSASLKGSVLVHDTSLFSVLKRFSLPDTIVFYFTPVCFSSKVWCFAENLSIHEFFVKKPEDSKKYQNYFKVQQNEVEDDDKDSPNAKRKTPSELEKIIMWK